MHGFSPSKRIYGFRCKQKGDYQVFFMVSETGKKVIHGGSGKRECENTRKKVLDFSASVNPYPPVFSWKCDPFFIEHYPDDDYSQLKEIIAKTFHKKPDEICVGNGSIELIRTCCKITVTTDRPFFYTETPTFGEYTYSAELFGGKHVPNLAEADLVFICNPNNPTGTLRTRRAILDLCKNLKDGASIFCADEAFIDLADPKESLIPDAKDNILVIRSLTKCFSVPGIRFGYGFGDPDLIAKIEAARLPWTVNSYAEAFALQAFRHYDKLAESRRLIAKERAFMNDALGSLGLSCVSSAANFLLVETGRNVEALCDQLRKRGILVRDCTSFGLPTNIRVAVRTREENEILLREIGSCLR